LSTDRPENLKLPPTINSVNTKFTQLTKVIIGATLKVYGEKHRSAAFARRVSGRRR